MRYRLVMVGLLVVLCLSLASAHAETTRYELTVVDQWEGIPTQAVIASRSSLEQALYNWIYVNDIFWKGMNPNERRELIDQVIRFNGTGLGVKILLPKVEKLKGVELFFLPFSNGESSSLFVVSNLRAKAKGGWEKVKVNKGSYMIFSLDGEHWAVNFIYNNKDALSEADKVIAENPEVPETWLIKASIYDFSDQRRAAEEYEKIISKFPDCHIAYNNLAMLYTGYTNLNLLDPERAVEYGEKACELTKYEDVGHLDTLARAYFVQGQVEKALKLTKENIGKQDEIHFRALLEWMEFNIKKTS